jgi:hypothetical protein
MRKARLDCDWHGENLRALGAMRREGLEFLPIEVFGVTGALDLLAGPRPPDEETWFVISGQHPQHFGETAARFFAACARMGIRILYYSFDDASRTMPCAASIVPHLSVLIHDESPLSTGVQRALGPHCLAVNRSWVANLAPFAAPFVAEPERKIFFLGSKLGLTEHRLRQIDFLAGRFKDRFEAICDHSLSVTSRLSLGRFVAGLCPEGRRFTTEPMRFAHTDRPFWSGCLGMVPVSEDSRWGGRLEELHRRGLIRRYPHGDLAALAEACEAALDTPETERRRIYDYFNRRETIGAVVAEAMNSAGAPDV